jgi:hypothetical protein
MRIEPIIIWLAVVGASQGIDLRCGPVRWLSASAASAYLEQKRLSVRRTRTRETLGPVFSLNRATRQNWRSCQEHLLYSRISKPCIPLLHKTVDVVVPDRLPLRHVWAYSSAIVFAFRSDLKPAAGISRRRAFSI